MGSSDSRLALIKGEALAHPLGGKRFVALLRSYLGGHPRRDRRQLCEHGGCNGVTAGLDGALEIAALLRGQETAEQIQLEIEYAPNTRFQSGRPQTALASVVDAVSEKQWPIMQSWRMEAVRFAAKLGVTHRT